MYGEIHGEKLMAENNLRSFIDHVGHIGIAKKDRYAISITGPSQTPWTGYIPSVQEVNMMCESISFPGQNIRSVPDTLRFGPAREHGQGITFGPFTAQFICSSDMREKMFFENWQNNIINERWEPNYYDNYTGSMLITQLDSWDRPTYQIEVVEAYPKTIMPQDMGYAQNNAYHTLGIEFTYRYWNPQIIEAPTNVDQYEAFTGGRGARETRAVDDFGFSGGYNAFAGPADMGGVDPMMSSGLTQFRTQDTFSKSGYQKNVMHQTKGLDRYSGFNGGRGLTQYRSYD